MLRTNSDNLNEFPAHNFKFEKIDEDSEGRNDGLVIYLVMERIIASTLNQTVEIAFIFEFLISHKLYTATLNITIIPP